MIALGRYAADLLRHKYRAPQLLIGHSLGGAAVLAATSDIAEVRVVVTIGAPSDPSHVAELFRDHLAEIHNEGQAEVQVAGRPFRITRHCLQDAAEQNLTERVGKLRRTLLVMHSPTDTTVDVGNATKIFLAAPPPEKLHLPGRC